MKYILTVSDQPALLDWAAQRTGNPFGAFGPTAEAVGCVEQESGKIRAVLVVNGFIGDAAVIHIASDGTRHWATKNIFGGWFGYVFIYKNLNRIIGLTPSDNIPAIQLALRLGFHLEGRIRRNSSGTEEDIQTSMFRSECIWIKDEPSVKQEAPPVILYCPEPDTTDGG